MLMLSGVHLQNIQIVLTLKTNTLNGILTLHSFGDTAFRPLDVAAPNERASDKTRIYYSRCLSDWISPPGHPRKQEEKVREFPRD